MNLSRRALTGLALGTLAAVSLGSPALADPAGPTDYESTVVAVEPDTPTIDVTVIGGDSFVRLAADSGTEVVVVGYQGEDYLWFLEDGTVLENAHSPTTYTNRDRYGGADIPATATANAAPEWVEVGAGGEWAWHDHRAHWMQTTRPAGLGAGDQILEAVIPLRVDGDDVDVTVISVWQPAPSVLPAVAGFAAGAAAGVAAFWLRHRRDWAWIPLPMALLSLLVGGWQYASLPPETGPRTVWWLLPALAVAAAVAALIASWLDAHLAAWAAALVAGVELAIWGFIKLDGLSKALIPTDAPGWLDRFTTALALAGGIGLSLVALVGLFGSTRRSSGSTVPVG